MNYIYNKKKMSVTNKKKTNDQEKIIERSKQNICQFMKYS
jgi:hypothetical protein